MIPSAPLFLLLFLSLSISQIAAEESELHIESDEAFFEANKLVLIDQIDADYGIGKITAKELSILSLPSEKSYLLNLSGDVQIAFGEGGKLYCQQAVVDYANLKSDFVGNKEHPFVTYSLPSENHPPLAIKSKELRITFEKVQGHSPLPIGKFRSQKIEAIEEVEVHYGENNRLEATLIEFEETSLHFKATGSPCRLKKGESELVESPEITIDGKALIFSLLGPRGSYKSGEDSLKLSSEKGIWDEKKGELTLEGFSKLEKESSLEMISEKGFFLKFETDSAKKELLFLKSLEQTKMTFFDPKKESESKIISPGLFFIDLQSRKIELNASLDRSEPVYLEEELAEMSAEKVEIDYAMEADKPRFLKIRLIGQVKIDRKMSQIGGNQRITAQEVDIFPEKHEMYLRGSEEEKVFLYDGVNNLELKAPLFKISYSPELKKEKIEGFGAVRCTFMRK